MMYVLKIMLSKQWGGAKPPPPPPGAGGSDYEK